LENGYLTIYHTEGGTNDWTELYRGSGSDKRFRFGNVFIQNGKLHYFGMNVYRFLDRWSAIA